MSNSVNPHKQAMDELERVLGAVGEELASWRRRALRAEADNSGAAEAPQQVLDRLALLETENSDLRNRVAAARERADGLMSRLHFFEQQVGD